MATKPSAKHAEDEKVLYDFKFEIASEPAGTVRVQLFDKVVPVSVLHFLKNVNNYKGSKCARLKTDGWLQIDVSNPVNNAETIPDENFVIKHSKGTLSLLNNGPNSNGTAFMLCLKDMAVFDGKYVAIGHVVAGLEVLDVVNRVSTTLDVPDLAIKIADVQKVNQ